MASPPLARVTDYVIQRGDVGWPVWGVNDTLNQVSGTDYGDKFSFDVELQDRIKRYQDNRGLVADGVVGPRTSRRMCEGWIDLADDRYPLPPNFLVSKVAGESSFLVGAINVNPVTATRKIESTDCSWFQRSVQAPYPDSDLKLAYNGRHQAILVARTARDRFLRYFQGEAVKPRPDREEFAWRLALLAHNFPAGADRLAATLRKDLDSYWTSPAVWVIHLGLTFADAAPVETPYERCQHYALGSKLHRHEGTAARAVTVWSA